MAEKPAYNKLKEILGLEYEDFVKELGDMADDDKLLAAIESGKKDGHISDEKVMFTKITIPVRKLHPTQNEIDVKKSLKIQLSGEYPEQFGKIMDGKDVIIKAPIITLNGKYIIDGHHRWSQVYAFNAEATMVAMNMVVDEDPIDVLKAVQMSIAVKIKEIPVAHVEGDNLLEITEAVLKEYVIEHIKKEVVESLKEHQKIEDDSKKLASEYVWTNVKYMQKTSKPIKDAPDRDVMPQTDDAAGWEDVLKAGVINFKEPVHAVRESLKHVKLFEQFINESTDYDSLLLGKTVMDVRDVINSLRFNSISGMHDKKIVALDQFKTADEAVKYLEDKGYSVGKMQSDAPRGITVKKSDIMKWRNLSKEDIATLDGILIPVDEEYLVLYFEFPED